MGSLLYRVAGIHCSTRRLPQLHHSSTNSRWPAARYAQPGAADASVSRQAAESVLSLVTPYYRDRWVDECATGQGHQCHDSVWWSGVLLVQYCQRCRSQHGDMAAQTNYRSAARDQAGGTYLQRAGGRQRASEQDAAPSARTNFSIPGPLTVRCPPHPTVRQPCTRHTSYSTYFRQHGRATAHIPIQGAAAEAEAGADGGQQRNSYLCLIKPCDTRWSSHLAAARRLLKLRTSVDMVLPQTPQFWSDLTEVVRFLEPFAAATDVVQSDRSTLYDFYTQFKTLIKHVKNTPVSSPFHIAKDSINNIIIGVWEKHVVMKAVITTAHLSFDSTVEATFSDKMPAARQWLADFASQYAVYWTLSTAATVQEARSLLTDEYSAFVGRRAGSCFANLQDDINEIRAAHVLQKRQFDPKAVWALYLDSAPVLAHAAIALLSIAGSEACVERSFSAQGTVHNDRRNRLKDSMVEAEMFIKFNRLALRKAAGEAVGRDRLELMTDEYDGFDDAPSVTELFNEVPVAEQDVKQPEQQQQQQQQQQPEEQEEQQLDSELEEAVAVPVVSSIPRPPPSTDDVTRFVVDYVRNTPHTITARFRWQPWHEQQLQAAGAAFEPPMRDTVTVLRRKVMQYVRAQTEQEAASDEVSAIVDIEQSE
jgi:hypothetical protein